MPHLTSPRLSTREESTRSVGAVIKDTRGKYLLQRRDSRVDLILSDHLGLFGGGVEPGETADAAMRRELAEELAFRPAPARCVWLTELVFQPHLRGVAPHHKTFYEFEVDSAEIGAFILGEGAAMEWHDTVSLATHAVVPWDHYAILLDQRRLAWRREQTAEPTSPYRAWF